MRKPRDISNCQMATEFSLVHIDRLHTNFFKYLTWRAALGKGLSIILSAKWP